MTLEQEFFMLEEVSEDQIEVEIETSETYLLDPLTDHNYILLSPKEQTKNTPEIIPHNLKIRQLSALYRCAKCGFSTLKKSSMDAHKLTHSKTVPRIIKKSKNYIPCPSCTKKSDHVPVGYEKCPKCSFFCKNETNLKKHMRIHLNDLPYKCTECDHYSASLKELIKHHEDSHKSYKNFKCQTCGFVTQLRNEFTAHCLTHSGDEPLICEFCDYVTSQKNNLTRHMKKHYK